MVIVAVQYLFWPYPEPYTPARPCRTLMMLQDQKDNHKVETMITQNFAVCRAGQLSRHGLLFCKPGVDCIFCHPQCGFCNAMASADYCPAFIRTRRRRAHVQLETICCRVSGDSICRASGRKTKIRTTEAI
jgi:hypothetical protein